MTDVTQLVLRFKHLMREVESGVMVRNSFLAWEVELLLDIQQCEVRANRRRLLRRYQRAAVRSLEMGAPRPLKLSEYMARSRARRPRAAA